MEGQVCNMSAVVFFVFFFWTLDSIMQSGQNLLKRRNEQTREYAANSVVRSKLTE